MKQQFIYLAAAGLAAAQPHRHVHQHLHAEKRVPTPVDDVVAVPGPTIVLYSLNGQLISEDEVMNGIKNGSLLWADGAPQVAPAPSSSVNFQAKQAYIPPTQPAAPSSTSESSSVYVAPTTSSTSVYVAPTTSSSVYVAPTTSSTSSAAPASSSSASSSFGGSGTSTPFPNGEIDCSEFPSAYGAVALNYLNLEGWSGIQYPNTVSPLGYDNIDTSNSGGCFEGAFCSYACPAGYQKSQWPSLQGITHQSVGGLLCQGGKLHLTNQAFQTLCIPGASEVNVQVVNKLSQQVSVCRTDYPGTEGETIPMSVNAGSSESLTCPNEESYYMWQGKLTSAQYYVNPAGVAPQDACIWGNSGSDTGNWAPLILGAGYSNGQAWISIFPNEPTTDADLDFSVSITGDNIIGACQYRNGAYYTADSNGNFNTPAPGNGCTASAGSGNIYITFD
ncbi:hypothetical protein MBLNU457_6623t1 [Dothideomycetes sp. NU457]